MSISEKWFVIANPVSGFGKVQKKWDAVARELAQQGIPFDFGFTTADKRGDVIARQVITAGYRKLICLGGDGHLQDMVNGIMTQNYVPSTDITVAMISMGTGNDWIKTNGIPKDCKKAVALIRKGKTYIQNVGLARSYMGDIPVERYFHNFAGVGFDAFVVAQTASLKRYGQVAYLLGMLKCLFTYKKPVLRIIMDHVTVESKVYLTLSGIGKYGGGGMKLTPGAEPDGDSFYVSIAKDFSRADVFRHIAKLYDGSYIHLDKAETHQSKNIRIEVVSTADQVYMEADGDMMGTGPWEISLINKALKVVIP